MINLAYEDWGKQQAKLQEVRNCDGLVAIAEIWHNWRFHYQSAIVKENSGQYSCSYEAFNLHDWY